MCAHVSYHHTEGTFGYKTTQTPTTALRTSPALRTALYASLHPTSDARLRPPPLTRPPLLGFSSAAFLSVAGGSVSDLFTNDKVAK